MKKVIPITIEITAYAPENRSYPTVMGTAPDLDDHFFVEHVVKTVFSAVSTTLHNEITICSGISFTVR